MRSFASRIQLRYAQPLLRKLYKISGKWPGSSYNNRSSSRRFEASSRNRLVRQAKRHDPWRQVARRHSQGWSFWRCLLRHLRRRRRRFEGIPLASAANFERRRNLLVLQRLLSRQSFLSRCCLWGLYSCLSRQPVFKNRLWAWFFSSKYRQVTRQGFSGRNLRQEGRTGSSTWDRIWGRFSSWTGTFIRTLSCLKACLRPVSKSCSAFLSQIRLQRKKSLSLSLFFL